MKQLFLSVVILFSLWACAPKTEISSINPVNWENRSVVLQNLDSMEKGSSYLSVYSQIYQRSEQHLYDLTATISIRNISSADSVFILSADYYDTEGKLIRSYFNKPVFVSPLETIEIVIDETDKVGGTGANFIFDWATPRGIHEPYFEAVMISTTGQQGLSFTTKGVRR